MKEDTGAVVRKLGEFLGGDFAKNATEPKIVEKARNKEMENRNLIL